MAVMLLVEKGVISVTMVILIEKSNRMWKSNVKSVRCKVNGAAKRMYVCTC